MSAPESVDDTEYNTLCHDCQSELDLDRPQYHGMVAFKGDFNSTVCDRCGDSILP